MVYTIVVHLYAKDDVECIVKVMEKLKEASQVYSRDKETLSWYGKCLQLQIYDLREKG